MWYIFVTLILLGLCLVILSSRFIKCPKCESTHINHRTKSYAGVDETVWYCEDCGTIVGFEL